MKVLALASYPTEAAATRFRLMQFVEPLARRGIELEVRPFINSRTFAGMYDRANLPATAFSLGAAGLRRLFDTLISQRFDVLLVQREAMLFGPPIVEWLETKWKKRPLVLDLDDATYVPYTSPAFGKLATALKFFGKTNDLIDWAKTVVCGNSVIADYVEKRGTQAEIIPTVVDTEKFCPLEKYERSAPLMGWIGTHSTFPFLQKLFPVLEKLHQKHSFELKIVGAGAHNLSVVENIKHENLPWRLDREIQDFQSLDIGLYPLFTESQPEYVNGKSGFKAIQYMSVGVPFVVSPVGVCGEIGVAGKTHFAASNLDEWHGELEKLLIDSALRIEMGRAGRQYALEHFTVAQQADKLAKVLFDAAS